MKVHACGIKHLRGTSRKNGKPFDFAVLHILKDVQSGTGYGYETADLPVDVSCVTQFASVKFPAVIEVATEPQVTWRGLETMITGLVSAPARQAA
jgi:hypothetical protein